MHPQVTAIHDLCAVGGTMIHAVPMQGLVDHGFVNYNPKFFWRLAEFNDYDMADAHIVTKEGETRFPAEWAGAFSGYDPAAVFRDMVLWVTLRKVHTDGFQPPFDGGIRSAKLARRYRADLVQKYNRLFGIRPAVDDRIAQ